MDNITIAIFALIFLIYGVPVLLGARSVLTFFGLFMLMLSILSSAGLLLYSIFS